MFPCVLASLSFSDTTVLIRNMLGQHEMCHFISFHFVIAQDNTNPTNEQINANLYRFSLPFVSYVDVTLVSLKVAFATVTGQAWILSSPIIILVRWMTAAMSQTFIFTLHMKSIPLHFGPSQYWVRRVSSRMMDAVGRFRCFHDSFFREAAKLLD